MRTYAIPVMGGRCTSWARPELATSSPITMRRGARMRESIASPSSDVTWAARPNGLRALGRRGPREGTALLAARRGQFQAAHDAQHLLRPDRQLRGPEDRVANILVVLREARGDGWNGAGPLGGGQSAVQLGRFHIPVRLIGRAAGIQCLFLRIEAVLDEGALGALNGEARPRGDCQHRPPQERAHPRVVQRDVERVVDGGAVALDADVGGDRVRRAEQEERLIEQVRAQVEPDPRAGVRLLAPRARPELRPEAVEVGFEARHPAEYTVQQQVAYGDEVTREAAVLVGREHPPLLFAQFHELARLRHRGGKRLVDHDVTSGQEALLRDRMM